MALSTSILTGKIDGVALHCGGTVLEKRAFGRPRERACPAFVVVAFEHLASSEVLFKRLKADGWVLALATPADHTPTLSVDATLHVERAMLDPLCPACGKSLLASLERG